MQRGIAGIPREEALMIADILRAKNQNISEIKKAAKQDILKIMYSEFPEFIVELQLNDYNDSIILIRGRDAIRFNISSNGYVAKARQRRCNFSKKDIQQIKARIMKCL
jgi:hypothetical protein